MKIFLRGKKRPNGREVEVEYSSTFVRKVVVSFSDFEASEEGEAWPSEAEILTLKPGQVGWVLGARTSQAFNDSASPSTGYITTEQSAEAGNTQYFQPALDPQNVTEIEDDCGGYRLVGSNGNIYDPSAGDMSSPFEAGPDPVPIKAYLSDWNGDGDEGEFVFFILVITPS